MSEEVAEEVIWSSDEDQGLRPGHSSTERGEEPDSPGAERRQQGGQRRAQRDVSQSQGECFPEERGASCVGHRSQLSRTMPENGWWRYLVTRSSLVARTGARPVGQWPVCLARLGLGGCEVSEQTQHF